MSLSLKSLWLLLKIKAQILINGFTKGGTRKRYRKMLALAGGGVIFFAIFAWIFEFLNVLANTPALSQQLINNAILALFLLFFIFLLASGITISIHYLFISSDLPLLLSSPLTEQTIFSFKLIEAIIANSSFFLFVGMPTFVAYGIVQHARWFYYPLMLLNAICFLAIPVSFAFLGALLIIRIIPAQRAREIMAILLAIVSMGIWLIMQIVRASSFDSASPNFKPDNIALLIRLSDFFFLNMLPSTWAARTLEGLVHIDYALILFNFLPLLIIAWCLFYFALKLSKKAFAQGLVGDQQSVTIRKKKRIPPAKAVRKPVPANFLSTPMGSIFIRDLKLLVRDSRQLTTILMFTAMTIIFPLLQQTEQQNYEFGLYRPYLFIILFGAMAANQLSSRLFPLEMKSFWITKLLPQSGLRIIWGKFLLSFSLSTILLWLSVTIISTYYGHPWRIRLLAMLAIMALAFLFSATGLFFGFVYARFDWDHPKRMLSSIGGLLMSLSTFVGIGLMTGIAALSYLLRNLLNFSLLFADIAASAGVILISFTLAIVFNLITAKKLKRMEWQF